MFETLEGFIHAIFERYDGFVSQVLFRLVDVEVSVGTGVGEPEEGEGRVQRDYRGQQPHHEVDEEREVVGHPVRDDDRRWREIQLLVDKLRHIPKGGGLIICDKEGL